MALILVVTLTPSHTEAPTSTGVCLICGQRGLADAILNVLFFIPLGWLAGVGLGTQARAIAACVLLSAGVESIQVFLPGRDGSPGDLVFNAVGGMVGSAIAARARRFGWSAAGAAPSSRTVPSVASLAGVAAIALGGWALVPDLKPGQYFALWVPDLAHLAPIEAHVEDVRLDGVLVPDGRASDSGAILARLRRGSPLVVVVGSSEPVRGLGGLFAIYDDRQREVVLLGRDEDDLVYRVERRASSFRLDVPDIRVPDLFGEGGNGRLWIRVERDSAGGRGTCVSWRSATGSDTRCGLGLTLGRGWALLLYPEGLGETVRTVLDTCWVLLLFVPAGLWARRPRGLVCVAAVGAALMILIPPLTDLLPTPAYLYATAAVGVAAGRLLDFVRWRPGRGVRGRP